MIRKQKSQKLIPMILIIFIMGSVILSGYYFSHSKTQKEQENTFIHLTDIHFNPYYDLSLIEKLDQATAQEWKPVFMSSKDTTYGKYGEEANFNLLHSSLKNMRTSTPNPDFIVLSGDFVCHDFLELYKEHTGKDNLAAHQFLLKTMAFVLDEIAGFFPQTPIFPALGNNDSYCGDYQLEAKGQFLKDCAKLWHPYLKGHANDSAFFHDFEKGGYYLVNNPVNIQHKLLMINSIFFSAKYKSEKHTCFCEETTQQDYLSLATDEIEWMNNKLQQNQNKNFWIVSHIPPGIDVFKTKKIGEPCQGQICSFWNTDYSTLFENLLDQYHTQIKVTLAGHTHMDDFKVIYLNDSPASIVHITPAITPVFGNNPGYERMEYSKSSAILKNYQVFYKNMDNQKNSWSEEYDFSRIYGYNNITPQSMDSLFEMMNSNEEVLQTYMEKYPVGSKSHRFIDTKNWVWYQCGMIHLSQEEYLNCKCK